jgi:sec-independent protein translocase protein TatA
MGSLSIWHILLVLVAVLIIFGAGKLPKVMHDLAKGIKSFKEGLNDDSAMPQKKITATSKPKKAKASRK